MRFVDRENGDVRKLAPVAEGDLHALGAVDHVLVRDDTPVIRDDDAAPEAPHRLHSETPEKGAFGVLRIEALERGDHGDRVGPRSEDGLGIALGQGSVRRLRS